MDTAPLPPVDPAGGPPGDVPTERIGPAPAARSPRGRGHRPVGRGLRVLEIAAGLCSGGLVLIGVALLVLQLIAPVLAPGTGLAAAAGPGWWRLSAHLGVGVAGELVVASRRRLANPVRAVLAAGVLVASGAVLWLAWWN